MRNAIALTLSLAIGCDQRPPPTDASADSSNVPDVIVPRPPPDVIVVRPPPDAELGCTPTASSTEQTIEFAITQFHVDGNQTPRATARPVYGFDLDRALSPTVRPSELAPHCGYGDYASALDPDQNGDAMGRPCAPGAVGCRGGVDNQLPAVLDALGLFVERSDPARSLNSSILDGTQVFIVRVSGVNGVAGPALCDEHVTIRVYRGAPLFADCATILEPGRRYAILQESLPEGSTDSNAAIVRLEGQIVNGRLRVVSAEGSTAGLRLRLPVSSSGHQFLSLELNAPQLRVSLLADGGLRDGNLGGVQFVHELVPEFARLMPQVWRPSQIAAILNTLVDIATPLGSRAARCFGRSAPGEREEGGIGMGIGFSAVRASLSNEIVRAPTAGMCGAM